MSTLSSFLFARPSFMEGLARILDMGNTLQEYNHSATPKEADFRAMLADWTAVGDDIQTALNAALKEQGLSRVERLTAKEKAN